MRVWLFVMLWTIACQAPLYMELSRQEYWRGLPISFARGSSQHRDRTWVSCIAGRFFTIWAADAAAAAKLLQSCLTLCDPIDGSPPGSAVPGILQARTLEWVAISFSNSRKWKVKVKLLSCVRPSVTPWTAAFQAPPSMGFSRQEYGVGCHCLLRFLSLPPPKSQYSFFLPYLLSYPKLIQLLHKFLTTG